MGVETRQGNVGRSAEFGTQLSLQIRQRLKVYRGPSFPSLPLKGDESCHVQSPPALLLLSLVRAGGPVGAFVNIFNE